MPAGDLVTTHLKRQAGAFAADLVESGMVVGLGVGSTAIHAVERIAERLRSGDLRDIVGVPCSIATHHHAIALGIPLTTLEDHPAVDMTIDGADEVDRQFNLIKGGGGALLREKIVAQASARELIVVDAAKCTPALGTNWPLPIEVLPFGHGAVRAFLERIGGRPALRVSGDGPYITDQGNYIYDTVFGPIEDPAALSAKLDARAGVIAHGLFVGIVSDLIVADSSGITHRTRER